MEVDWIQTDDTRWEEGLRRAKHDFYHVPAYVAVAADVEGGRAGAIRISDGTDAILWPQIERAIPRSSLTDLVSPYGYPGPVSTCENDARTDALFRAGLPRAIDLLRSRGVVSMFSRLHPLIDGGTAALADVGTLVEHGTTVSIDCTIDDATAFAQYRTMNRRHVRAARRSGFVVRHDPDFVHLPDFIRLYNQTMERIGASRYYFFPDRYYEETKRALGDRASLWLAERDGQFGAAVLFTEVCGIVQYHLSANDEAFASCHPTKLIIDTVRSWAHERGDACLHLGGGVSGSNEDNLFFFKAGFGPRRHPFRTLRVVVNEDAYAKLSSATSAPNDASRAGFFPAYRAA